MANWLLTIQHNGNVFSPPIEEGVQIEWERTGSPGKLTFKTIKIQGAEMGFQEGDPVCFYCDDKLIFKGYVFTKKRDREHRIEVTCYDQIRYLKNKYTYVFENKTATQIVTALCNDFSLDVGDMDNTNYVIPAIAEENIAALDIVLDVLEETLLNTGNMFVFYDDAGQLKVKNCANMVSDTLIMSETAENFDYTSSIDDETYNNIVLYYKNYDNSLVLYTASSPSTIKQWGTLRYFEETDTPTTGLNKANSLLQLFNRKTRELKVSGAFGDISVRAGTLIPVKLDLGDVITNNYMLVEKVTHNFDKDYHTMDLTLEGAWEDQDTTDAVLKQFGEVKVEPKTSNSNVTTAKPKETGNNNISTPKSEFTVRFNGNKAHNKILTSGGIYAGITYMQDGKKKTTVVFYEDTSITIQYDAGTDVNVIAHIPITFFANASWTSDGKVMGEEIQFTNGVLNFNLLNATSKVKYDFLNIYPGWKTTPTKITGA